MNPNEIFRNAIVGKIIASLVEIGKRVHITEFEDYSSTRLFLEICDKDGMCEPSFILLNMVNEPSNILTDYSVDLEEVLAPVIKFCESMAE